MILSLLFAATVSLAAPAPKPTPAPPPTWESTLDRVSKAVVSIEVTAVRDFDTETAGTSFGTGFVVDAARGLLLTNRHMVHAGPVTARATFLDNEEVELHAVYRDPVHDFGVYRFDPAEVRFMPLVQLSLAPDAARVGLDIRVVGNDAGEKLSILDGTLARLDRNAPFYGTDTYNDFDTFYFQAASNTSGGSSGSPVVDLLGRAVALNAGGSNRAASSFYLPLDRVVRALDLIQRGQPVPRGTIQANFTHQPWEDIARLGLRDETEVAVRAAVSTASGMLVVSKVQTSGPADTILRPGDVLVKVDGRIIADFVSLESWLDDHVGQDVPLTVERLGVSLDLKVPVRDLHAITPDDYLEVGRAIVHDLSYQQARNKGLPVAGAYVASSGYIFESTGVSAGDLIVEVDGVPVADADAVQRALEAVADKARVRLRVVDVDDPKRPRDVVVTMDRTWFSMRRCRRDDTTGLWPCVDSAPPPSAAPQAAPTAWVSPSGDKLARTYGTALVLVQFTVPYSTGGLSGQSFVGTGVVVDVAKGLVVVDRDTVPVALGDLTLTFGATVRVPGTVVWLHPGHDFVVISYDPASIGAVPVTEVTFSDRWVEKGDDVAVVGLDPAGTVVRDSAEVEGVDPLVAPISDTPRFRETNVEVLRLAKVERSVGGVVLDKSKRVVALWASFFFPRSKERSFYGLPSVYIAPVVAALRRGETPEWRALGAELVPVALADARERGLPDDELRRLVAAREDVTKLFEVVRVTGGSPAASVLRPTDLVLSVNGVPLTHMRQLEASASQVRTVLTVLRGREVLNVSVETVPQSGEGIRDALALGGMILHAPHAEVASQQGITREAPYIAWFWYGTPAARDGLRPTRRVLKVGETEVRTLDDLVAAVAKLDPERPIVLTLEDLAGRLEVKPIELDLTAWPTERMRWEDGRWTRTRVSP